MSDSKKSRSHGENTLEFLRDVDGFEAPLVESAESKRETDRHVAEFLKALLEDDHSYSTYQLNDSPRPPGMSLH